jgi:peptidoglycan/LPS O-acetylase OafA/YrhL
MGYGSFGVNLFFVLSGFLVSGLLFSEYRARGSMSIKRFYVRRAWKIYPPLYLMLVITYVYERAVVGWRIPDKTIFSEMFFITNYYRSYWNHTWSLAVEEHFYITLPLLLAFMLWRGRGKADPFAAIPRLAMWGVVLFAAIRLLNFAYRTEYSYQTHVFATHLRLDALLFGVGIAYFYHFQRPSFDRLRALRYALMAGGVALLAMQRHMPLPGDLGVVYYHTLGLSVEFLAGAALMIGVLHCNIPKNAWTTTLARLGAYSYSIYLWHMATIYWVLPHVNFDWHVKAMLYLVAAFLIGIPMAKLAEAPMLKLRDRLYPSFATQPAVVSPGSADRRPPRRFRLVGGSREVSTELAPTGNGAAAFEREGSIAFRRLPEIDSEAEPLAESA